MMCCTFRLQGGTGHLQSFFKDFRVRLDIDLSLSKIPGSRIHIWPVLLDKLSSVIGNEPEPAVERIILDLHTTFFFPFGFIFSWKHTPVKCTMGPRFLWSMTFSGMSLFACVFHCLQCITYIMLKLNSQRDAYRYIWNHIRHFLLCREKKNYLQFSVTLRSASGYCKFLQLVT